MQKIDSDDAHAALLYLLFKNLFRDKSKEDKNINRQDRNGNIHSKDSLHVTILKKGIVTQIEANGLIFRTL